MKAQAAQDKNEALKAHISEEYQRHGGCYGYRRITMAIRNTGHKVNRKRIHRLMKAMGLRAIVRVKKYRSYRGEVGAIAPNRLQRCFSASRPNSKWTTDITEFKLGGDKLYLSPIMDLFNGEIVSYEIQRRPTFNLVKTMLVKALVKLHLDEKPLIHSDQGWQYRMSRYQKILSQYGLSQSMSRKGNCYDNAAMESFFGTLKSECFHHRTFKSLTQLEKTLHEYIHYYNHDRIKLKLKGLSPIQYKNRFLVTM